MNIGVNNDLQSRYLRLLKPYQRIQLAFELHDLSRSRIAGEIKRCHSDWTDGQVRNELNRRFLG